MSERIEIEIGKKYKLKEWDVGFVAPTHVGEKYFIGILKGFDDGIDTEVTYSMDPQKSYGCTSGCILYESPQPTPPSNEWPCKPECGNIEVNRLNPSLKWFHMQYQRPVYIEQTFCERCGSKRPAEKKEGSPTGSAYLDAVLSTTERMEKSLDYKGILAYKKEPVWMSPELIDDAGIRFGRLSKDKPLKVKIENGLYHIPMYKGVHSGIETQSNDDLLNQIIEQGEQIKSLITCVNALISGEGVLKILVDK